MGNHLIVMHSAVRACPGYSRHDAPAIGMDGNSLDRETEHGLAVTAQFPRRHGTLAEAIDAGVFALGAAHLPKGIRRQSRTFAEDYFYNRLELTPEYELDIDREIPGASLGPMPEGMLHVLAELVEAVVEGDYHALHRASDERLAVDDMRRRVEVDCPAAFTMPPVEHFQIEAIAKSDEAGDMGWSFFLDLWEDDHPAQLHIEGELTKSGERYRATLLDIGP